MSGRLANSTRPALLIDQMVFAVGAGIWAAAVAVTPSLLGKFFLTLPVVAAGILLWVFHKPARWLYLLFFCLLALPPLPVQGETRSIHLAPFVAVIGLLIGMVRYRIWSNLKGRLPAAFALFVMVLLVSTLFAAIYSGTAIAAGSFVRILLFTLSVYVFEYTLATGTDDVIDPVRFARFLFFLATAAALFACVDFYFQLPAPAGYGAQFVWLDQGVFRRAQGLFYEASTLGNFCAFFLMLILVCLFQPKAQRPIAKAWLVIAGAIFAAALIFSYSRGSIVNFLAGSIALVCLRRYETRRAKGIAKATRTSKIWRVGLTLAGLLVGAFATVRFALPSFSSAYWSRILTTLQYASSSPNGVLSGRLTSWYFLGNFLWQNPWTAIFGVGYKTLPYSDFIGATIVADNTYLQLLVETGVVGLLAFLFLNYEILKTGWRASRSVRPTNRLFGEWIFCFWVGQVLQMLSGDLITYWRVLPVYFWVLAIAARE